MRKVSAHTATGGRSLAVMIGIATVLSACATRTGSGGVASPRQLGRDVPVYKPVVSDGGRASGPAFANPTDTVSLRDVVALALLHSPDLAAFAWETRARDARAAQASRLPNPVVGVVAEDFGTSRTSNVVGASQGIQRQTTLQLSQLVELAGKRTARHGVAASDRELAAWDYEAARIDVLTRVTHAFIDVLAAQELVALTRQTGQLVQDVRRSVGDRVVAGVVSPIEETKAELAVAASGVESDRAERLLSASRARLAAHWGSAAAMFARAAGDLTAIRDLPSIAALTSRLADNPELARWATEISQRQAALSLEKARRIPDLTLTVGYRRFDDLGVAAYVAGVSLPLPVFDRNSGGTDEAQSRLSKAYEERRAAEARVSAALSEAYGALANAHAEVTLLRETVLPRSRQVFDAVNEGYRLGRFGYLDVLEAQRTLIGAGGQYLRAASDYHKAVATVERLVGAPLTTR